MATIPPGNKSDADKRSSERIDARIDVKFRNGNEFIQCYSQNLSKGGIYLETETLPDPNAVVELVLNLPQSSKLKDLKQLSLRGRIVRLMSIVSDGRPIHKLALQFTEVPPQVQMQLDLLYEEIASAKK